MAGVKALKERRGRLRVDMQKIIDRAEQANRDLSVQEEADFQRLHDEDVQLVARIKRQQTMEGLNAELDELDPRAALLRGAVDPGFDGELQRGAHGRQQSGPNEATVLYRDASSGRVVQAIPRGRLLADLEREEGGESIGSRGVNPFDIGDSIASMLLGKSSRLMESFGTSTGGGEWTLKPPGAAAVYDLGRSASVAIDAGVKTLRMEESMKHFVRVASDPTPAWRHENVRFSGSSFDLDRVTLVPRTMVCAIPVSLEALDDCDNVGQLITTVMQRAMGLELDRAILGVGAVSPARPVGVLQASGVNQIASVGVPVYDDIIDATEDVLTANYPGALSDLAWLRHPRDAALFAKKVDGQLQPLQEPNWVSQIRKLQTTSLPVADGGGANESSMIVGSFGDVILGMRTGGVVLRILESGTITDSDGNEYSAAAQLGKIIICHLRADVCFLKPQWLVKLTGCTLT